MERHLDFALKVLKLMKYGERTLADEPIKVLIIVLGAVLINKAFDAFNLWLIRYEERQERERMENLTVREVRQLQASGQLNRELSEAAERE